LEQTKQRPIWQGKVRWISSKKQVRKEALLKWVFGVSSKDCTVQQDEEELKRLVLEEQKKLEEKAAAARASEIAKQKTAERAFEAASQRTAEKYAERNAKRRARAAERAAEGLEEEDDDEQEQEDAEVEDQPEKKQVPNAKHEAAEAKTSKQKQFKRVDTPREPLVIGGRKSFIWMAVIVVLFLAVFILSKVFSSRKK
jgi:cobalamin biosynthesis Mg chelatase CobN